MTTTTCVRCGEPSSLYDVDITDLLGDQHFDVCNSCSRALVAWLTSRPALMLLPEFLDDIDDAEHHAACRCHECDPDWAMELARDNRYDAERQSA
jgi:hypothetical protein